jgi:hypothetical protein
MLREMEELCYPPITDAKAIPTGTAMLRLAGTATAGAGADRGEACRGGPR